MWSFRLLSALMALIGTTVAILDHQVRVDQGKAGTVFYDGPGKPLGQVYIKNYCQQPMFMWPVFPEQFHDPKNEEYIRLSPNTTYIADIVIPRKSSNFTIRPGGISFKISDNETKAGNLTQLEYSVATTIPEGKGFKWRFNWLEKNLAALKNSIYLSADISLVDCAQNVTGKKNVDGFHTFNSKFCPAAAGGLKLYADDKGGADATAMECAMGDYCPWDLYFEPEPAHRSARREPVARANNADSDLIFVLCSGSTKSGGNPAAPGFNITRDDGPAARDQQRFADNATTSSADDTIAPSSVADTLPVITIHETTTLFATSTVIVEA